MVSIKFIIDDKCENKINSYMDSEIPTKHELNVAHYIIALLKNSLSTNDSMSKIINLDEERIEK